MHTYAKSEWRDFHVEVPHGAEIPEIVEALGFLTMPAFHVPGPGAGADVYYPTLDNPDIDSYLVRFWSHNGPHEGKRHLEHNRWITCTTLADLVELLGKIAPIVKATGPPDG